MMVSAVLAGACAAPPPPIDDPAPDHADRPAGVTLAPPSNGIAGSGPDQPALPQPAPATTAPAKNQTPAPNDPGPPGPKAGSSEKCNSQSTFSISEWKKIEAAKTRVDFDVISSIEGSMQVLDHETSAIIEADRSISIDPVTGGPPTGSFRGLTAVSGQRLLLRADWGDCLVVVVP